MSIRLVILGATGDLTSRYLMPAIAGLHRDDALPTSETILGVGQEDWDDQRYQTHIREALDRFAENVPSESKEQTARSLRYRQGDVTDSATLGQIISDRSQPVALYLALPPAVSAKTIRTLSEMDLPEKCRIIVEKPFGEDAATAQELNDLLHKTFPEELVFRIDHFLGKQTVQNMLGVRFGNRIFESQWNREHIERVDIVWDETLALEGRAGYYDSNGALRDMVQNHLLQLLTLTAMEAPLSFNERDFRDRKIDVLRAVRKYDEEQAAQNSVRGRYLAGWVGGRDVPDYVNEPGVDPERMTETFAQTTLFIDNWRWSGVPFVLRTGKALAEDRHEICVRFRQAPHLAFENACPQANVFSLRLNPDRLELEINVNGPGNPFDLEPVRLETRMQKQKLTAYARLLVEVFEGDATLSIRGDEAVEAWRIVEPFLAAWRNDKSPMREYRAGSPGDDVAAGNANVEA